jgi:hypothetical protein
MVIVTPTGPREMAWEEVKALSFEVVVVSTVGVTGPIAEMLQAVRDPTGT